LILSGSSVVVPLGDYDETEATYPMILHEIYFYAQLAPIAGRRPVPISLPLLYPGCVLFPALLRSVCERSEATDLAENSARYSIS
jgi:hypothetical protein